MNEEESTRDELLETQASECFDTTEIVDKPQKSWESKSPNTEILSPDFSTEKYSNFEFLGEGASATVFKATETALQRSVAIKLLKPDQTAWEERFVREKNILANLSIPGIPSLLDHGKIKGADFFAMEYVDGHTLSVWQCQKSPSLPEKVERLRELAVILSRLHEEGICHRDLKPENIMINSRGELRLMDMGVACTDKQQINVFTTIPGQKAGSPAYFSPEAFMSETMYENANDNYALGVVAYTLLCDKRPYSLDGLNYRQAAMTVASSQITHPNLHNTEIPLPLDNAVMNLLAKEPGDRLSASEFVNALENIDFTNPQKIPTSSESSDKHLPLMIFIALIIFGLVLWFAFKNEMPTPNQKVVNAATEDVQPKNDSNGPTHKITLVENDTLPQKIKDPIKEAVKAIPHQIKAPPLQKIFANIHLYKDTAPLQEKENWLSQKKYFLRDSSLLGKGLLWFKLEAGMSLKVYKGGAEIRSLFTSIEDEGSIHGSPAVNYKVVIEKDGALWQSEWQPQAGHIDFIHYKNPQ